jgi:hypothetical protein
MRSWTVHAGSAGEPPELVREGFSWAACLFGPLWLLGQRLWLAAAGVLLALILLALAPPAMGAAGGVAMALLLGWHGRDLRRAKLARLGRPVLHVVREQDADRAMQRVLDQSPFLLAAMTSTLPGHRGGPKGAFWTRGSRDRRPTMAFRGGG